MMYFITFFYDFQYIHIFHQRTSCERKKYINKVDLILQYKYIHVKKSTMADKGKYKCKKVICIPKFALKINLSLVFK